MSESASFRADDVKWIIDLVSKNFNSSLEKIEKTLEKVMSEMVSRKEFDELKKSVTDLKDQVTDTEKTFGIMESIKRQWKFLSLLSVIFGGMCGGMYIIGSDIHVIAKTQQQGIVNLSS